MINFQIFGLTHHLRSLEGWERTHSNAAMLFEQQSIQKLDFGVPKFIPKELINAFEGHLVFSTRLADTLELQAVHDRLEHFRARLRNPITQSDFANEIRVLREAFESGINYSCLYLYPTEKAKSVLNYSSDWANAISKFPAAKDDIQCAVDCWALGHGTASIFHAMRVAEYGLRAVAKERKIKLPKDKLIEWANWQEIIKAISEARELIARTKKAGPVKDEALAFYSGSLAHLEGFKDKYRNVVMHARVSYDEHQAASALLHVREFMNGLARKIGEDGKQIRWRYS